MPVARNDASLGLGAKTYVFSIIAAGVAVAAYSVYDLDQTPGGAGMVDPGGADRGQRLGHAAHSGMPISFSISDTFNIAAALLFGPSAGAITAALDGLVLSSRMESSSRSVDRVLFNMAAPTVALWVAAQVFFALGGNHPSARRSAGRAAPAGAAHAVRGARLRSEQRHRGRRRQLRAAAADAGDLARAPGGRLDHLFWRDLRRDAADAACALQHGRRR